MSNGSHFGIRKKSLIKTSILLLRAETIVLLPNAFADEVG
jgi:hypothetical protein